MATARSVSESAVIPLESAVSRLHRELRSAILAGTLPPGVVMTQLDLAERLGGTRTPLREALRMLEMERLITGRSNRRVEISRLSPESLEELQIMRLAVEGAAVRLTSPQLSAEQIGSLEGKMAQISHYYKHADFERLERPHSAFHMILVGGAGPIVSEECRRLYDHVTRYRRLSRDFQHQRDLFSDRHAEHRQILDAVQDGDHRLAHDLLIEHHVNSVLPVFAWLNPEYDPRMLLATGRSLVSQPPPNEG